MLDWPRGAVVLWPPLFDATIAGLTSALYGPHAERHEIERVAAFLPFVLGLLTVLLVAALGRVLLGAGGGLGPALVVALLMGHIMDTVIGRADQHAAESLLSTALLLAFVLAWRTSSAAVAGLATTFLALAVCASFWNWMGSALYLVTPLAFVGVAHLALGDNKDVRRAEIVLATGLAGGAILLGATVGAWGAPDALHSGSIRGVTAFHVALVAIGSVFPAVLSGLGRMAPQPATLSRRAVEVVAACTIPLAALAWLALTRSGLGEGLEHLAAGGAWLEGVFEFSHLLFSCRMPLEADFLIALMLYGLTIPASFLAVPALIRRWRTEPGQRPVVVFLAVWGAIYLVLAFWQRRFASYSVVPLALLSWEGLSHAARSLVQRLAPGQGRRAGLVAAIGALIVVLPSAKDIPEIYTHSSLDTIEAFRWLGSQTPARDGDDGVLTSWNDGHLVRYYSGKPAVVSPFGTDGGADGMIDAARFDTTTSPSMAENLLHDRRVGFVVASYPLVDAYMQQSLAKSGGDSVRQSCSYGQGVRFDYADSYRDQMAPRLYFFDGLSDPRRPAAPLEGLRLMYESAGAGNAIVRIFGVVPGARVHLHGARASTPLFVEARISTGRGRQFTWREVVSLTPEGTVDLRLPYATGANGTTVASFFTIGGPTWSVGLAITEEDVVQGRPIDIDLARIR